MNIQLINGPNLNLLGKREPTLYGWVSFDDYLKELQALYPSVSLDYYQSNTEGFLIDKLHEAGYSSSGIILNAGAYTHTSIALADAISSIDAPVIEVHISNIFGRESFRHKSLIAPVCMGSISGFGLDSYRLAIEALLKFAQEG